MMAAGATPVFLVLLNGVLMLVAVILVATGLSFAFEPLRSAESMQISLILTPTVIVLVAFAWWLRRRFTRKRRPVPLSSLVSADAFARRHMGAKTRGLARLMACGQPVLPGWALAAEGLEDRARAARLVVRLCRRVGYERIVIRSSFLVEDDAHLFPGVFHSAVGVDARSASEVERALAAVLASAERSDWKDYATRLGADEGSEAGRRDAGVAVVIQPHVDPGAVGVISSIHPEKGRPDQVVVELGVPDEEPVVDVYSHLYERWLSRDAIVDEENRDQLLLALRFGEQILHGPAVIEFGVLEGRVVVFQLRRCPEIPLLSVWTRTGPVALNPEPMPRSWEDRLYGPELERLREGLDASLARQQSSSAPAPASRIERRGGLVYVDYGSIVGPSRYRSRLHTPGSLIFGESRRVRRVLAEARSWTSVDVDTTSALQSRVQESAESMRTLAATVRVLAERPGFAPLFPWPSFLIRAAERRARALDVQRNRLHETIVALLGEADAPQIDADAPLILLGPAGTSIDEALPPGGTEESVAEGALILHASVPGEAEGVVVSVASNEMSEDAIVVVPDGSTRWTRQAIAARGVLLVGSGRVLSHLALVLREQGIPTLSGLTADEARSLEGQRVRLVSKLGGRGILLRLAGNPSAEAPRR